MHVLITGGAGLLGQRLARQLLQLGRLRGADGSAHTIRRITLLDMVAAPDNLLQDTRVNSVVGDVSEPACVDTVLTPQTHSVFHLAAVVSGQAEADFDLGMRINLDATRLLLERARQNGNRPRFVFTSSVAAFGGALPAQVPDDFRPQPQSSYGVQKVIGELLVKEYTRRDFIDGRALRMPTVCVRPGLPNKAASSFASGIIREPLHGIDAVCPVSPDTVMWLASPANAIDHLVHGHDLDGSVIGHDRILSLPGLSITVREMAAALQRVAGAAVAARIQWQSDAAIERIVNSWPGNFITARANALGFAAEMPFDDIVRAYMRDYLHDA